MPRITPYLFYNDVESAMNWLQRTFGFTPKGDPIDMGGDGVHAEMGYEDGFLMMGSPSAERGGASPQNLTGIHQSLYVYVVDVDAHYQHTLAAGAATLTEPTDMFWGDRVYAVKDLEGHHWSFATHMRDVSIEELGASLNNSEAG